MFVSFETSAPWLCRRLLVNVLPIFDWSPEQEEDMQEEPSRSWFASVPFAAFSGFETRSFACTSALLLQSGEAG